jgi:RNA polymerase sigma-70 factor, ECF subfamily
MSELDDKNVLSRLKKGDFLAFNQVFYKYYKKVYYFAFCYLKNTHDAEEVAQEVFLNLWKFRKNINEERNFSNYIFKITYNAVCRIFRARLTRKKQMDNLLKNSDKDNLFTAPEVEFENLLEEFEMYVDRLPAQQKKVFILSTRDRMESEKIAEQMNISLKTVENYLAHANTYLKNILLKKRTDGLAGI